MPWTIEDHKASAQEALDRGVISGNLEHLADVPEPEQSTQHQARVSALSILNELGGPEAVVAIPWTPWKYYVEPPIEPPVDPPVDPPVEPPVEPPVGDVPFGSRPRHDGQLHVTKDGTVVENLHFVDMAYQFDGSNDHVGILIDGASNVTVRNCDFENMGQPMAIVNGGDNIVVEDCRCDGITGPSERHDVQSGNFIQTVGGPTNVTIRRNKIKGGDTEDIISLFSASNSVVSDNWIDGSGWSSDSGTGIILGDGGGDDNHAVANRLYNPGQVGIAVAGGRNNVVEGNLIFHEAGVEGANIAAYCNNYYPGTPFGNNGFYGNRAFYQREDGSLNGFWNPGGAETADNRWEDDTLTADDVKFEL